MIRFQTRTWPRIISAHNREIGRAKEDSASRRRFQSFTASASPFERYRAQSTMREMLSSVFLLLACASLLRSSHASVFRDLGSFSAKSPSFLYVGVESRVAEATQNWTLLISSFSGELFAKDAVYYARNVQAMLDRVSEIEPLEISSDVVWPNEFNLVPGSVFPGDDIAVAATGFLVPGKSKGTVSLFNMGTSPIAGPSVITKSSTSWFYHRVTWHDMNADGRMDILTARADKPIIGSTKSELVWLEQPASNPLTSTWPEHVLLDGPDVFFVLLHLHNSEGVLAPFVVSANYFSKKLELIWPSFNNATGQADWSAQSVKSRVLDTLDAPFDVKAVDANSDGKLDIVVTVNNERNGSVLIYEIPSNFTNPSIPWPKHTIATGFRAEKPSIGRGSPGSIHSICLPGRVLLANGSCERLPGGEVVRPTFLLSGDDGGSVYLLSPTAQAWTYEQEVVLSTDGTVGQLCVTRIGDANTLQVFVPDYVGNKIDILST